VKIIEETTRFVKDIQIDLNYLGIQKYKNPLVIATREGQIARILDWQDRNNYPEFSVIGWWDLMNREYICANGLIRSKWTAHDIVIFLDKNRCSHLDTYEKIIMLVINLL
jgi:hypothetical protein